LGPAAILLGLLAGPLPAQTAGPEYERGLAALNKGDLDTAIAHVRKAVEIQPEFPEAHNRLGFCSAGRAAMRSLSWPNSKPRSGSGRVSRKLTTTWD